MEAISNDSPGNISFQIKKNQHSKPFEQHKLKRKKNKNLILNFRLK